MNICTRCRQTIELGEQVFAVEIQCLWGYNDNMNTTRSILCFSCASVVDNAITGENLDDDR